MEQDISLIKQVNLDLFNKVNSFFGNQDYHKIILLVQKLFDSNTVLLYLIIFSLSSIILLYKARSDTSMFESLFLRIMTSFTTLFASGICLVFILVIKNHAGVTRPFCQHDHLYRIDEIISSLKCNQSFPSGHMSQAIAIAASFWNIFNRLFKFIALIILVIVGIGRIAAGAHYPIDLLGAIIITLPTILYMKSKIYNFLEKLSLRFGLIKIAKNLYRVD